MFAVIGFCFAYFYLLSSGLELHGGVTSYSGTKAEVQATVRNNGFHELKGLSAWEKSGLSYIKLESIGSLKPNEEKTVSLELDTAGKSEAIIVVRGSFQGEVSATVPLLRQGIPLEITLSGPNTVFQGSDFNLELELCNPTRLEMGGLSVFASPKDKSIVSVLSGGSESESIPKESCLKKTFSFHGLKPGKAAIIFNIKAPNDSKTAEKEITVAE